METWIIFLKSSLSNLSKHIEKQNREIKAMKELEIDIEKNPLPQNGIQDEGKSIGMGLQISKEKL